MLMQKRCIRRGGSTARQPSLKATKAFQMPELTERLVDKAHMSRADAALAVDHTKLFLFNRAMGRDVKSTEDVAVTLPNFQLFTSVFEGFRHIALAGEDPAQVGPVLEPKRASSDLKVDVIRYRNPGVTGDLMMLGYDRGEAEELFIDTLQFLFLCGTIRGRGFTPPVRIDHGWHAFILRDHDYRLFCQTFFGRYIGHMPRNERRLSIAQRMNGLIVSSPPCRRGGNIVNTLTAAQALFGELSSNWVYEKLAKSVACDVDVCEEKPLPDCDEDVWVSGISFG